MDINEIYNAYLHCDCISTDSREVAALAEAGKKVLFVALKGDRFDGNAYAADALKDGAECAIVSDDRVRNNGSIIHVQDTLKTLQGLAHIHRKKLGLPVIAVTGSNGKTTTKELVHAVLSRRYNCRATAGNLNNHIGVPLTLLSLTKETEIAIVEMGANHPGEIHTLANIAAPDYGIITNIGRAHLEGFGGEEGVMRAKGELFDYLAATGGTAIYNRDLEKVRTLAENLGSLKKIPYSSNELAVSERDGYLRAESGGMAIQSHLVGDYNVYNIAAALAVGATFGVEPQAVREAIEAYVPGNSRSQLVLRGDNRFIIDAYNANPSSMALSLENFIRLDGDRKAVVLGDMKELGGYSLEEHARIVELVGVQHFFRNIFVGNEFKAALDAAHPAFDYVWCPTVEEARQAIADCHGATVLVKGSNSTGLHRILSE